MLLNLFSELSILGNKTSNKVFRYTILNVIVHIFTYVSYSISTSVYLQYRALQLLVWYCV